VDADAVKVFWQIAISRLLFRKAPGHLQCLLCQSMGKYPMRLQSIRTISSASNGATNAFFRRNIGCSQIKQFETSIIVL